MFALFALQNAAGSAAEFGRAAIQPWVFVLVVGGLLALSGILLWLIRRTAIRREALLREYRTAFRAASEPAFLLLQDLTILHANDAAYERLQQPRGKLERTRLVNWVIPDEEQPTLEAIIDALQETGRASFWATLKTGAKRANVDVRLTRTPPDEAGKVLVVALLYDITEYREEGKLFKTLHERMLTHMPIEVGVLTPQGEYMHMSPSTMGGPSTIEWAIGKTDVEYGQRLGLHPEVALRRRAYRRQAVSSGKPVTFEEELTLPDNQIRHFERTYAPVIHARNVFAVISYGVDRTAFRQERMAARSASAEVEDTQRLRDTILSNLSHEFRTPLSGILGAAQILNYEVSDQGKEFVEMIEQSGRRLMNTLNSLLDLAGLRAGSLEAEPRVLDLGHEIESAVETLQPDADAKGLFLRVKPADGEIWIRVDQGHLHRVLQNLVGNAIKFTDAGGIVIELEQDEENVHIRVMDTGIGVDAEHLAHLFDEFRQESGGIDRQFAGVGVGLAVSRRLVEQMGGKLSAESQKGEGSTFTVTMPLAFRIVKNGRVDRATVVVVEPNAEDRRILEFTLRSIVNVRAAASAAALRKMTDATPDAVLLSVAGVPGGDSTPVDEFRAASGLEGVPVLALDANPAAGNRETYLRHGFVEYVPKPLNRQVLLDALAMACA